MDKLGPDGQSKDFDGTTLDEIEEGPLDETSISHQLALSDPGKFYNFQVEETLSDHEVEALNLERKSENANEQYQHGILFSPEGNEGFMFTKMAEEKKGEECDVSNSPMKAEESARNTGATPREINEDALVQRYNLAGEKKQVQSRQTDTKAGTSKNDGLSAVNTSNYIRSESQSVLTSEEQANVKGKAPNAPVQNDVPKKKSGELSDVVSAAAIQNPAGRPQTFITTAELMLPADSPRMPVVSQPGSRPGSSGQRRSVPVSDMAGGVAARDRLEDRIRSRVGSLRLVGSPRQFEESFNSADSTASPRSTGYLTDRATSPSVASVASAHSVSSQTSVSGRRYLEWDYGSDLGYVDGQLTQLQAAKSLSTLGELTIGNYSEYLRDSDSPRGLSGRSNVQDARHVRPPRYDDEYDLDGVNIRMAKFAESLMRQRQFREQELSKQERRSRPSEALVRGPANQPRTRSRSRERKRSLSRSRLIDQDNLDIERYSTVGMDPMQEDASGSIKQYFDWRNNGGVNLLNRNAGPLSLPVGSLGQLMLETEFSSGLTNPYTEDPHLKKSASWADFSGVVGRDRIPRDEALGTDVDAVQKYPETAGASVGGVIASNVMNVVRCQGSGPSSTTSSSGTVINSRFNPMLSTSSSSGHTIVANPTGLPPHLQDVLIERNEGSSLSQDSYEEESLRVESNIPINPSLHAALTADVHDQIDTLNTLTVGPHLPSRQSSRRSVNSTSFETVISLPLDRSGQSATGTLATGLCDRSTASSEDREPTGGYVASCEEEAAAAGGGPLTGKSSSDLVPFRLPPARSSMAARQSRAHQREKDSNGRPPPRSNAAWTEDDDELQLLGGNHGETSSREKQQGRRRPSKADRQSHNSRSIPSTSDEDFDGEGGSPRPPGVERQESAVRRGEDSSAPGAGETGNTSTMESAHIIHRAKSFEYIPGESFPIQENSSSYEYLPGHLVQDQRPPTVIMANESPSADPPLSPGLGAAADPQLSDPHQPPRSRTQATDELPEVTTDPPSPTLRGEPSKRRKDDQNSELERHLKNLDLMSNQLRGKTRDLMEANLAQTKYFFKKLKRYINFLSTPSQSVEECRLKQKIAERISLLLATEESRLDDADSLSWLSGSASSLLSSTPITLAAAAPADNINKEGKDELDTAKYKTRRARAAADNIEPGVKKRHRKKAQVATTETNCNSSSGLSSTASSVPTSVAEREKRKKELPANVMAKPFLDLTSTSPEPRNSLEDKSDQSWKYLLARSDRKAMATVDSEKELSCRDQSAGMRQNGTRDVNKMQSQRIQHLRNLQRELKKLERLEVEMLRRADTADQPTGQQMEKLLNSLTSLILPPTAGDPNLSRNVGSNGILATESAHVTRPSPALSPKRKLTFVKQSSAARSGPIKPKRSNEGMSTSEQSSANVVHAVSNSAKISVDHAEVSSAGFDDKAVQVKIRRGQLHMRREQIYNDTSDVTTVSITATSVISEQSESSTLNGGERQPVIQILDEITPRVTSRPFSAGTYSLSSVAEDSAKEQHSKKGIKSRSRSQATPSTAIVTSLPRSSSNSTSRRSDSSSQSKDTHVNSEIDPQKCITRPETAPAKKKTSSTSAERMKTIQSLDANLGKTGIIGNSSKETAKTLRMEVPKGAHNNGSKSTRKQGSLEIEVLEAANKENLACDHPLPHRDHDEHHISSERKAKPVAYYLPIDNLSPIRIGKRILRDRSNAEEGTSRGPWLSSQNRVILTSYMASVNHESLNTASSTRRQCCGRADHRSCGCGSSSSVPHAAPKPGRVSLNEALLLRRPNFVRRAERRRSALAAMKSARLLRAAKHEAWLEDIRCLSPEARRYARPNYSPVPQVRLFSHREMVAQTRAKYVKLPEVKTRVVEAKIAGKYQTNRIMADMYSRRLQRRVIRHGRVSLKHHDLIVD